MEKIYRVFVYGTLRKHESNHYLIKKARCVSSQSWTNGILYDTGDGYPGMAESTMKRVYGEVYEVDAQQLELIDALEEYKGEGQDNLYERIIQMVHTDFGTIEAYVYVYASPIDELEEIGFGDWKCHQYLHQNEFLYYAYGSCMDDERFKRDRVKHQFERVVGCGIVKNFSIAYTLKAHDGGRADLIESAEQVEGKVYRISSETLTYLYRREGVNDQIYRPTFIDVTIDEKTYRNVLTFLVVDKEKETAPPEHYATEILRGAKGFVSNNYYQKLLNDLNHKFGMELN